MEFGECVDCETYKFIEKKSRCPTCLSSAQEWVVLYATPYMVGGPEIHWDGLTEEEAKEIALGSPNLFPRHESAVLGTSD